MSSTQSDVELLSKLAGQYRDKGNANPRKNWADILKAHTLYNACASRSSAKKWREKAFEVQKIYVSSTLKEQTDIARGFQANLYTIRDECKDVISPVSNVINRWDCTTANLDSAYNKLITTQLVDRMKTISLAGNTKIKVFAGKLIQRSVELCRKPVPCKFATVALGSLAKGEATPYSDLEFMFLLQKKTPEIVEYFETLAMTAYFLIGNLRETKLKYMNIVELKKFTDKGKNGFKIDGLQAKAGNIPTGNGTEDQKNKFILTVEELLDKYQNIFLNPDPEESKKGDFTSMLAHTTVIYGEPNLLSELNRRKNLLKVNDARMNAHNSMIKQDVEDYDFMPLTDLALNNHSANLKSAIYRFPSLLTYNLKIIYNIDSKTSWETLDKLFQMRKLSQSFYVSLQFLLASALYIRMAAYLHHDSQNDDMIFVPSSAPTSKSHYWHLPQLLHVQMSLHMIPVKKTLILSKNPVKAVATEVEYDMNAVYARVSFYAGNYIEALNALERLPLKGLAELTMISECYKGLQRWNEYHPIAQTIIAYIRARPFSRLLAYMLPFYKYRAATGYAQAGDFASAKKGFEEVLGDLPPHLYYNHEIYAHASNFYSRIFDQEKARHYYEKACNHLAEVAPTMNQAYYDTYRSQMLHNRAATLIDTARYNEAEPLLMENIKILKRIYGENGICIQLAHTYHALGNLYGSLRQHEKAHEYRHKAEKLYELINPTKGDGNNLSLQHIGFALTYEGQGNLEKTLEHYFIALELITKYHPHNHPKVADMKRRIGFILSQQNEYVKAERYLDESLAVYTSLEDSLCDSGHARCHHDLGRLFFLQKQHRKSLYHLYKAISFRYNQDDIDHADTVSHGWYFIGRNLYSEGNYEAAAESFHKSGTFRHKLSQIDSKTHALNYYFLGQCYILTSHSKPAWDRYIACSMAHRGFVKAISILCHDKSPTAADYSELFLIIAAKMAENWLRWRAISCTPV